MDPKIQSFIDEMILDYLVFTATKNVLHENEKNDDELYDVETRTYASLSVHLVNG